MANFSGQDFSGIATLVFGAVPALDHHCQLFSFTGSGGTATVLRYLMRALLSGSHVYWYATSIDQTGAEYPGGPVGLSNIVFIKAHP